MQLQSFGRKTSSRETGRCRLYTFTERVIMHAADYLANVGHSWFPLRRGSSILLFVIGFVMTSSIGVSEERLILNED
ncbi:hypothetical protein LINPERPRIM_LOCUS16521 [Linum perenne]